MAGAAKADSGNLEGTIKKFKTNLRVYWSDCDAAGIVYYGNFFRYFEIGEEEFYNSLGRSRPDVYNQIQVGFPRVETWCRYYKPARLGDLLELSVWIGSRTQRTMKFCFELRREGEHALVAEGNYTVVSINRQFQPIPMPEEVLKLFTEYLPPLTERATAQ